MSIIFAARQDRSGVESGRDNPTDKNLVTMEYNMRVKVWVENGELGEDYQVERELVQVPIGHWAVIVDVISENTYEPGDYLYHDQSHQVSVISQETTATEWSREPEELILRHSTWEGEKPYEYSGNGYRFEGSYVEQERILMHSSSPFVVVQIDGDVWNNVTVHLARQVTKQGLGPLPDFPLPDFIKSRAGRYGPSRRASKWVRLTQVAAMTRHTPHDLLKMHEAHFNDFMEDGILFLRAESDDEIAQAEQCEHAWSIPDKKELLASQLKNVWVSKYFTLVALYCHHVGWHTEQTADVA